MDPIGKRSIKMELPSLQVKQVDTLLKMLNGLSDKQVEVLLLGLLQQREEKGSSVDQVKQLLNAYSPAQRDLIFQHLQTLRRVVPIPDESPIHLNLLVTEIIETIVVTIPFNTLVDEFVSLLIRRLDLPLRTANGEKYTYFLVLHRSPGEHRILERNKTLYAAGVVPGCVISVVPHRPITIEQ